MEEALKQLAFFWFIAITAFCLACGRGEIKGSYAVELSIAGVPNPLLGTLILSTQPLDIPSIAEIDESIDSIWLSGDAFSANSCFILEPTQPSPSDEEHDPGFVRVFEIQIQSNAIQTPIEILNASDLRIEIADLQFFANAVGGELDVHTQQGDRPGRIHGARTGPPSSQQCIEALDAFRAFLRDLPIDDQDRH